METEKEIEYVQTEYDRITKPVADRYRAMSTATRTLVPLDVTGRDETGQHVDGSDAASGDPDDEPSVEANDLDDGKRERRGGFGWLTGNEREK